MNNWRIPNISLRKYYFRKWTQRCILFSKISKIPGYDDISFNVVNKCFGVLCKPFLHIFNLSVQTRIFLDKPKIASVNITEESTALYPFYHVFLKYSKE